MRELPITMTGDSVRAILAGTKTQTRRVIDKQPQSERERDGFYWHLQLEPDRHLPRYQVGDLLWVREAWRVAEIYNRNKPSELARILLPRNVQYDADETTYLNPGAIGKPRSSRFMPKVFARIWLEVTGVRAERLQDISVDDCRLEGCCCSDCPQTGKHSEQCKCDTKYYNIWNDLNAKRGFPWKSNPWVWVYEFGRVKK